MARGFEVVSAYEGKGINLPVRKTKFSAGYDVESAEDIVIPSIFESFRQYLKTRNAKDVLKDVEEKGLKAVMKDIGFNPILVPTGLKAYMEDDEVMYLVSRSSNPLKKGLILTNGIGIIDSDFYQPTPTEDGEEGMFYFQFINFLPFSVKISKGEALGQAIFQKYLTTDDDNATGERIGGLGSTDKKPKKTKKVTPKPTTEEGGEEGAI